MAADTIKVGAILAVTGPASFLGAPEAKTLEMLTEEHQRQGRHRRQEDRADHQGLGASPEKAISFAKQLIEEEKVFAIIGPSTSGETMAIKNLAEESKTHPPLLRGSRGHREARGQVRVQDAPDGPRCGHQDLRADEEDEASRRSACCPPTPGFGKAGKEQIEKLAPEHGIQIARERGL